MNEDYPWWQDPEDDMEELEEKAPGEEIMEDTNPLPHPTKNWSWFRPVFIRVCEHIEDYK